MCAPVKWPLFALVLVAVPALSQVVANAGDRTISGQVINSVTGQPIERALVQIGPQYGMLTDHEGRFSFSDVPAGSGGAFASKPGYFLFEDGHDTQPLTLKLIPEAIFSGTVTDPVGRAIQGLHVQLRRSEVRNGIRSWLQLHDTTTNVEGEYRFAELQAGKYRVVTSFLNDSLPEAASSITFMPANYPPADGDAGNGSITVIAGEHAEANLIPAAEKAYPVTGVIQGPINHGFSIDAETADGEPINLGTRIFPNGAFRLTLPSGSYRIKVQSYVQPEPLFGNRDLTVGHAPLESVAFSLEPRMSFPVEVDYQTVVTNTQEQSSGTPSLPPSLNVALEYADPNGRFRAYPAEPLRNPGRAQVVEPGGPLIVKSVESGRYILQAQVNPPWYLASASCDNLDLMRNQLVVSSGMGACTVRAVVRNDSSSLRWSIPASDAMRLNGSVFVSVLPLGNLTVPAQGGTFSSTPIGSPLEGSFSGLAPGQYLVLALPRQQEIPYRDAEAMKAYTSLGQEVTLAPGGEVQVQLQPAARVP
jgi:hypothetical protein